VTGVDKAQRFEGCGSVFLARIASSNSWCVGDGQRVDLVETLYQIGEVGDEGT